MARAKASSSTRPRWLRDATSLFFIAALLSSAYLLPPDNSLAQVRDAGTLRVCVPSSYPPLVTGKAEAPGIDIELLEVLVQRLELRLDLNPNDAMGRDFNPRNWHVTRAQCQLLAGGVVSSAVTRSFLETTHPYLQTGWVAISNSAQTGISGVRVGVFPGVSGLDRLGLSRYLRSENSSVTLVPTATALEEGLMNAEFEVGITEALTGTQIASSQNWDLRWLPEPLERYPLVFGLWKGDLTLKRALQRELAKLQREGVIEAIIKKYLGSELPSGFDIRARA